MADYFYCSVTKPTFKSFISDLTRFLADDLDGYDGPGYTIKDTYSSGATTPHEVPSDDTDFDSLAADNSWRDGNLVLGDYCVLEDQTGTHQVVLEYHAVTQMKIIGLPTKGWVVGNDDADPEAAGNFDNPRLTTVLFYGSEAINNKYSIGATENHFKMVRDPITTYTSIYWMYAGELEKTRSGETRGMVVLLDATDTFWYSYIADFYKLSMVDGTTVLSLHEAVPKCSDHSWSEGVTPVDHQNNLVYLCNCLLISKIASHYGLMGRLQGVYTSGNRIVPIGGVGKGTLMDGETGEAKAYAYWHSTTYYGAIVFKWDGKTDV